MTTQNTSGRIGAFVVLGLSLMVVGSGFAAGIDPGSAQQRARQILDATGVQGGLIVHLGCGDGRLTAALRASDGYLVHGLDAEQGNVRQAREHIRSLGLYGSVSAEQWSGALLPYADNLVNLLVAEDLGDVPMDEVMRVLAPNGAAYVKRGGEWIKTVKPRPEEIDEWTHFLHGPDNNAVAQDSIVGPPHHLQWVGEPRWARSHDHLASVSAVVCGGGRIFSIVDEGPTAFVVLPGQWRLVARDAFSGVVLWKRPIEPWEMHLRGFRSGPPEISRRLVAAGDRVYVTLGYGKPLTALDAATGRTVKTYQGTDGTLEIVCRDGVLFLVAGDEGREEPEADAATDAWRRGVTPPPRNKRLLAIEADTGELLWKKAGPQTAEVMPTTLAVSGGRVFFQNADAVVCLDAKTGEPIWRADRPISVNRLGWSTPTLVVYEEVVLSADREVSAPKEQDTQPPGAVRWEPSSAGGRAPVGELIAFSANDGRRLWSCPCRECYNAPVDVLVADGLVWTGVLVRASEPGITAGRDPNTGEIKRQRPPDKEFFSVGMGHHRCHRNKATNRYLVMGRAGVEFIDLATGRGVADHWVRGGCQYGVIPCNGLLYAPSHSCACYIQAKLNGFLALAPKGEAQAPKPKPDAETRLERGPAYSELSAARSPLATRDAWPTYRHDPARGGCTSAPVPSALERSWQADLGGRITPPVIAEGRVFVAQTDAHTVCALDAGDGKPLWSYTAGGRVDSPPTIHQGLALFGSADGCVYCLRASDGRLVWRFRAAPEDRRVVAYGQLESAWPVHGNVLVQDGAAYFVAGRSIFLDGGMYLYRLDPATGKKLALLRMDGRDPKTGQEPQDGIRGTDMPGALPDVLSSDGQSLFMRHKRFDLNCVEQEPNVPHLFSSVGFLDGSWWHRTYWLIDTSMRSGYGGWPVVGGQVPAGRLLVFDESSIYGFGRNHYVHHGSHVGIDGADIFHFRPDRDVNTRHTRYHLFRMSRNVQKAEKPQAKPAAKPAAKKRRGQTPRPAKQYQWSKNVPLLVRAMVLADETLFVAGPPLVVAPDDPAAALQGRKGGRLWAVSTADGKPLAQHKLEAPPVFDGMAAAGGRLYLATTDGRLLCYGGP